MARREKELTRDEALELARQQLEPFWIGSPPLLAGVMNGDRAEAIPLDPSIREKTWLLVFADPAEIEGIAAVRMARVYLDRYSNLGLSVLLVMRPPYMSWRSHDALRPTLRLLAPQCKVAIDSDSLLSRAFAMDLQPAGAALLDETGVVASAVGELLNDAFELRVQERLRRDDPGLSMHLAGHLWSRHVNPTARVDFGAGRGAVYPAPGFVTPMGTGRLGRFAPAALTPGALAGGSFSLSGEWLQDEDGISTSDPYAILTIDSPSDSLAIVGRSLAQGGEATHLEIESAATGSIPVEQAGKDISMTGEGVSSCAVSEPRLYEIARALGPDQRRLTLRFPLANLRQIQLHGLRFGRIEDSSS